MQAGTPVLLLRVPGLGVSFSPDPAKLRALGSEKIHAFQGIFPGPWPPCLLGYWGLVVEGCETNWAREGSWSLTQLGGISLWAVGGRWRSVLQQRPLEETQSLRGQYFSVGG